MPTAPHTRSARAIRRAYVWACAVALAIGALALPAAANATWAHTSQIGVHGQPGQLRGATAIARDASGDLYVADRLNNRIQKFDSAGAFVSQFGSLGAGAGQLHQPTDLAIDASGDIWVVDHLNHRVQKFDPNGVFLAQFGSFGSGNGQFNQPYGIALDAAGDMYVTELLNSRVQKFDPAGAYLTKWGNYGALDGQFSHPKGLAVSPVDGSIYVTDFYNQRVQQFTSTGTFVAKFGRQGGANSLFYSPSDVEVDPTGTVFVADLWMGQVQQFDSSHVYQTSSGYTGAGEGQSYELAGIELDPSNNLYTVDSQTDKIQRFDSAGAFQLRFASSGAGQLTYTASLAKAADGTIYALDTANGRVVHYSSAGVILHSWGSTGTGNGRFNSPQGIAVSPDGSVYVADRHAHRIQRFAANGTFLGAWGAFGAGDGQLNNPNGIAVAADGTVWVTQCGNDDRVQRFTATGTFIQRFGSMGTATGQFHCPNDIAIQSDGTLVITDLGNNRIQQFNQSGVFVRSFGTPGNGPGQINWVQGVAVAPNNDIYVADANTNGVARFNGNGVFQEWFGPEVLDNETTGFGGVRDVVATGENSVWVAETMSNRISNWVDTGAPAAPLSLVQRKSDGATTIANGGTTDQSTVTLRFDLMDPSGSQTLTPWVEIRPIGTPLTAACGASVPGVTFSGANVSVPLRAMQYGAQVAVTGLTTGTDYHWRACAVDQGGLLGGWQSYGGSDGTRDLRVDLTLPFTVSGVATRDTAGTRAWQACDNITPNVSISVSGGAPVSTSCDRLTGSFTFTGLTKPGAGQMLVLWMAHATSRAATYVSVAGDPSSVITSLVQDRVTLDVEATSGTISATNINTYDGSNNGQIPINNNGSAVTYSSGIELHVTSGVAYSSNFALNGGSVRVGPGATFTSALQAVTITGSGTDADCTLGPRYSAPLCIESGGAAAFTAPSATVTYQPAVPSRRVAVATQPSYYNLVLAASGTFVLGTGRGQSLTPDPLGRIDINGRLSSDPWSPAVTSTSISVNGTWTGSDAFQLTVVSLTGSGRVDLPNADVIVNSTNQANSIGSWQWDWELGSLDVRPGAANGTFGIGGALTIDSGAADAPGATTHITGFYFTGYTRDNGATGDDWAIARHTTNGAAALPWGTAGTVTVASPGPDRITAMAAIGSTAYVAGSQNGEWAAAVPTPFGVSSFFGTAGFWKPGITGTITAMSPTPDGSNLVVVGTNTVAGTWEVRIVNTSGVTVQSISWDGDTGSGATEASALGVCVTASNTPQIYVVGSVGAAGSRDWAAGKLTQSAGTWVWSPFGSASPRPSSLPEAGAEDRATTCHAQGTMTVIGGTMGDGAGGDVGEVRAFMPTGAVYGGWGVAGARTFDGPGQDYLTSVLGYDRRIFITGGDSSNGGRMTLRALDADGESDTTFNNGTGVATYDSTAGAERGVSLMMAAGNFPTVVAASGSGSGDVTLLRYDFTGQIQNSAVGGTSWVNLAGSSATRLIVHGDVTIGSGHATRRVHVDGKANDGALVVDGTLRVRTDGSLRAPDHRPLEVGGDLTIEGAYWHEGGLMRLVPRTRRTQVNVTPSTVFADLMLRGTHAGTVAFDSVDDIEVSGAFTAQGRDCTDPLRLRPIGASWTLTNTGGSLSTDAVDFANTTVTPARSADNSWDGTGNAGLTFNSPCATAVNLLPPDTMRTNGVEHARAVRDAPPPYFTWVNRAGANVDLLDIDVMSSPSTHLAGLYRFDATQLLTDSSSNGSTLLHSGASHTSGKYGMGLTTAPTDGGLTTPPAAAPGEMTVDGWFNRGALTAGDHPYPTVVARMGGGPSFPRTFALVFLRDANQIALSSSTGGTIVDQPISATPYTDGQWHHAAVTVNFTTGYVRAYLDGELVATIRATSSIDTGVWSTAFGPQMNGTVDDWAIRSVESSPAEVMGYYRTGRRHLDSVWSAVNQPLPSTADAADVTVPYAGAIGSLARDRAWYWVSSRVRTAGGTWSTWNRPDWFETTLDDQTTVSLPNGSSRSLGTMLPGNDAHVEFAVRTRTTSANGWTMQAFGEDDTYAMSRGLSGANHQIPRRTTPSWTPGASGFAGLTVLSAPGGKIAPWCGNAVATDFAAQCYAWPTASTGMTVHRYDAYSSNNETVQFSVRANPAATTNQGQYSGRLSFVVLPNP